MRNSVYDAMSDEAIVSEIERLATEMSECERTNRYKRLALEISRLGEALKSRGPASARKLLPLLSHNALRVRFWAAGLCESFAPEKFREVLREILLTKSSAAIDAMVLLWDRGEGLRMPGTGELMPPE